MKILKDMANFSNLTILHKSERFFLYFKRELINSAASVKALVFGDSVSIAVESGNDQHQYLSIEMGKDT